MGPLTLRSGESVRMSLMIVASFGFVSVWLSLTADQALLALVSVLLTVAFGWRAARICLRVEPEGVLIRNTLRSHYFAWREVAEVVDAKVRGPQGVGRWGLGFVSAGGRTVVSVATGGHVSPDQVIHDVQMFARPCQVRVSALGRLPGRLRPARQTELESDARTAKSGGVVPVHFHGVRHQLGYDPQDVDDFLATIGSRTVGEVQAVQFRTKRGGYDLDEVDCYLEVWSS